MGSCVAVLAASINQLILKLIVMSINLCAKIQLMVKSLICVQKFQNVAKSGNNILVILSRVQSFSNCETNGDIIE